MSTTTGNNFARANMQYTSTRVSDERLRSLELRAQREELQRKFARKRLISMWRSLPKNTREAALQKSRKTKYQFLFEDFEGELESQGWGSAAFGATVGVGVSAAVIIAARQLQHLSSKVATQVDNLGEQISQVGSKIAGHVDAVGEQLTEAGATGASILRTAQPIVDFASQVFEAINLVVEASQKICGALWKAIVLIFSYVVIHTTPMSRVFGDLIMRTAAKITDFSEQIYKRWLPGSQLESQSGVGSMKGLFGFVATAFCCTMLPTAGGGATRIAAEVMRRFSMAEKAGSGFEFMFEQASKYLGEAVNIVRRMCGMQELDLMDATEREIRKWTARVDEFQKLVAVGNPTMDQIKEGLQVLQDGVCLKHSIHSFHMRNFVDRYLDKMSVWMQAHRGALAAASSFRQQPIFALFVGASGIGKTSMLQALALSVLAMAKVVPAREALQNMWQKGTTEYWNGYVSQKCLIMDDCFQQRYSTSQTDNEPMTIIRAVGNWAFPLNFADVESKGRFYFGSPLIIGTTNTVNVASAVSEVIRTPEAVTRRIAYPYKLILNSEYTTPKGKFDFKKAQRIHDERMANLPDGATLEEIVSTYPWEAWTVQRHCFDDGRVLGSPEPMWPLIRRIAHDLTQRTDAHKEDEARLDRWAKYMEKIPDNPPDVRPEAPLESQADVDVDSDEYDSADDDPAIAFVPYPDGDPFQDAMDEQAAEDELHGTDSDADVTIEMPPECFALVSQVNIREMAPDGSDPGFLRPDELPTEVMMKHRKFMELMENFRARGKNVKYKKLWLQYDAYCDEHGIENEVEYVEAPDFDFRSYFMDCAEVITRWLSTLPDWVQALLVGLASSAASFTILILIDLVIGVVRSAYAALRSIFGLTPQSDHREGEGPRARRRGVRKTRNAEKVVSQLGNPPQDVIHDIVYRNLFRIVLPTGAKIGHALALRDQLFMMPLHFEKNMGRVTFVSCYEPDYSFEFDYRAMAKDRHVIGDTDLVMFNLPHVTRARRDIVKFFLTSDQHDVLASRGDARVRLDSTRMRDIGGKRDMERVIFHSNRCEYRRDLTTVTGAKIEHAYEYDAQTEIGDCGSVLCLAENRYFGGAAVLGLHVAGKAGIFSRFGYTASVTREEIEGVCQKIGAVKDAFVEDLHSQGIDVLEATEEQVAEASSIGLTGGSTILLGTIPEDKVLNISTKSCLKRSEFDLFGEPPTMPAVLKPVLRDVNGEEVLMRPMVEAMRAYQAPLYCEPIKRMEAIVAMATREHWRHTQRSFRRLLTPEEAVRGVEGLKLKAINRTTSCGYPYRLEHAGKRDFFGDGHDYELTSEAWFNLRRRVLHVVEQAKQGTRLAHVYTDFLKDELRPLHKVASVATRAISGAPVDYVIAVRMYFGAFIAAGFENHTISGMAPGINVFREWHILCDKMQSRGKRVFAGDFKRYDASEQPYVLEHILAYINRWYKHNNSDWTEEDDRVRSVLFMDLLHSRHLTGPTNVLHTVVQWNKSMPSGHPLTTPVNSLYSLITLTACYAELTGDYQDMWDRVYICTFGDDNTVNVSDTVSEVFNQETVAVKMWELFRMTYTSDKKDAELRPWTTIDDITFLKRTMVRADDADGGWVAPLAKESFMYTPYWYRSNKDPRGDMATNIKGMLEELSLHGRAAWDEHFDAVCGFCLDAGVPQEYQSYEQARQVVLSRNDAWY